MEWKRVGKAIKIIVIVLLALIMLLVIGVGTKLQVDTEEYIQMQKGEYGFVEGRKRIKYTPVLIYWIQLSVLKLENRKLDIEASWLPWEGKEYRRDIYDIGNSYMQLYLIHCFYTDEEKKEYIKRRDDNPWDQNKYTPDTLRRSVLKMK